MLINVEAVRMTKNNVPQEQYQRVKLERAVRNTSFLKSNEEKSGISDTLKKKGFTKMIQLTEDLAMIADDHCYIVGKPRQRPGRPVEMENPTYYTTAE